MKQIEQEKQVLNALNSLLYDFHYSLAMDSAYKGDYSLAGTYITELIKLYGEKPVLLDLNAKINAQQGNYNQAEFLWQKCIKMDSENRSYLAALARLHKIQRSNSSGNLLRIGLIGGIASLSLLLILLLNNSGKNRDLEETISNIEKHQKDIFIYLNEQKSVHEEVAIDSILLTIFQDLEKIEGLIIQHNSSELIIHFQQGLFKTADYLIPSQKFVIISLAKALEPYSDKISVLILGCTDDLPITDSFNYSSNNALSIARAAKVYDVFYSESRLLMGNIKIASALDNEVPFQNVNHESRIKNRTTVIKIQDIRR